VTAARKRSSPERRLREALDSETEAEQVAPRVFSLFCIARKKGHLQGQRPSAANCIGRLLARKAHVVGGAGVIRPRAALGSPSLTRKRSLVQSHYRPPVQAGQPCSGSLGSAGGMLAGSLVARASDGKLAGQRAWGFRFNPPTDLNPHDGPRLSASCTRAAGRGLPAGALEPRPRASPSGRRGTSRNRTPSQ
jgi:hypothetical protein